MDFQNGEELLALCSKEQCSISEIIIRREVSQGEESRDSILQKMQKAYRIMETSAHESSAETRRSCRNTGRQESHCVGM